MNQSNFILIRNAESIDLKDIPLLSFDEFREQVFQAVEQECWIASLFAAPDSDSRMWIYIILAHPASGGLRLFSAILPNAYESLTPDCPQAHWFERELAEQWGVQPIGQPVVETDPFSSLLSLRNGCLEPQARS